MPNSSIVEEIRTPNFNSRKKLTNLHASLCMRNPSIVALVVSEISAFIHSFRDLSVHPDFPRSQRSSGQEISAFIRTDVQTDIDLSVHTDRRSQRSYGQTEMSSDADQEYIS